MGLIPTIRLFELACLLRCRSLDSPLLGIVAYWLVKNLQAPRDHSEGGPQTGPEPSLSRGEPLPGQARRFTWKLAGLFFILTVVLGVSGYVYLARLQSGARAAAHQELAAIADLKLRQISNWREERLSDASFFSHARFVAQDVRRFLQDPSSEAARSAVLHWLNLLKSGDRYYGVAVFDSTGQRRLGLPSSADEPPPLLSGLLKQAQQRREVVMTDLHRDATNGLVHLDILFPIFEDAEPKKGLLAVVLLKVDARHFLFPLIQSWPTPSRTAESLLVRREGNDVLYLNDLRHKRDSAMALRLPITSPNLPAAKVLQSDTNVVQGTDYRGIPVVAAGRLVPGTSWAIVSKMDREEIYAPLRQQMLGVVSVVGALLVASALFVAFLWRQRTTQFLERELTARKVHEREIERMNRLYGALSGINQAVVRARSQDDLLGEICRVLVQLGGLQMAWVGWVEAGTRRVTPVAQFGDEPGHLKQIQPFGLEENRHDDPVAIAIREARPFVCNNLASDPKLSPWLEAVARFGWHSVAVFPIRQEGSVCGALAVCASQRAFFGAPEQDLMEEAAADVAFGLDTLLNDQRRSEAEDQLRLQAAALQSAANGIVITGRDGMIQWVNPAFERLTGFSAAEAIGQDLRLLNSGQHDQEFFKEMWEVILAGNVWQGEVTNKRKDGTLFTEEMTITPVRDAQGEITHFIAIEQDVTPRKQAEAALQDRNAELEAERARWQGVVEGIADEVWTCDVQGRMSLVNLPAITAMGLEEFKDQGVDDVLQEVEILNPDGLPRPAQDAPLLRSLRGEILRGEEIMVHRRSWKRRWRQFSSAPTRDATGAITGAVAIVRDITEERRIAEALRQSEEQLRVAAMAAEIGVWSWTPGTNRVAVSANWRRLFGIEPGASVTFETWRDSLHVEDRERAVRELNAASEEHRDFISEYRVVRPDGTMRWIVDRGRASYDDQGRPIGMAGINVDITKRKMAEEALRQARDELAQANVELEQKVEERTAQLLEANANLQTFAYTAAHDLRSPLRAIRSFSAIALEECGPRLDEDGQSYLQRVSESAEQMERLLSDLLEYSKLSQAELKMEAIDLQKTVADALALLQEDIRTKGADVLVEPSLPTVLGHPATLLLVLTNLISNGLKFIAPGTPPRIRVWVQPNAGLIRLGIEDNGIGITPEDQKKLFQAFQRLHGKSEYPGTGLGLAIVRRAVERMGGKVGLKSEPGKGSCFWADLKPAKAC
jgi:PAS domain S-box-containing protein